MYKTNVWYNIKGDVMVLHKIKKLSNGKYQLTIGNNHRLITYDEVILKYNLLYKKEIDSELLEAIFSETSFYDVYNKVVKFISIRLRSEKEIKNYLKKYSLSTKEEEECLQKLKNAGLLNDESFAKAFISDKLHLTTMGPYKIRGELEKLGISSDIIEQNIKQISEDEVRDKLQKLMVKKIKSNKKYSQYALHQKLLIYFRNLGYSSTMIEEVFANMDASDHIVLQKEYEKIERRLSKKYEGPILKQKIKEKLYQKGFSWSEVNQLFQD